MADSKPPTYAYEDFHDGRAFDLGPLTVTAAEIVEFARAYDPQPMHLDEAAGKASVLGGLAASGWHMTALMMKMMTASYILDSTSEGAPGVETIEWKRPLLAGDTIHGTSTVVARRLSGSRRGIGLVTLRHDICNQHATLIMTCTNTGMMRLRNPEAAA